MDRLPLVMLLAALGCGDDSAPPAAASRVVAVAPAEQAPEDICEARPRGKSLVLPELSEGSDQANAQLRWVNVWATWCRPCVEEMPLITEWKQQLEAQGVSVDITFVSADSDQQALVAFRQEHPDLDLSRRIADPESLPAWATQVGLDEGAPLPVHVWAKGTAIRCARAAGLHAGDYEAVRAMLRDL